MTVREHCHRLSHDRTAGQCTHYQPGSFDVNAVNFILTKFRNETGSRV